MRSQDVPAGDTPFTARKRLFHNADLAVWMSHADKDDETVIANADGDDLIFVQKGSGRLESPLGVLEFGTEDYVYVPRWLRGDLSVTLGYELLDWRPGPAAASFALFLQDEPEPAPAPETNDAAGPELQTMGAAAPALRFMCETSAFA